MQKLNVFGNLNEPYNGILITDKMRNGINYNGNTRKFGVTLNNKKFIIKFAKDNDLSVFTEYLASHIMQYFGINAQNTYYGKYYCEDIVIIEDFTTKDVELHSFKDTKQSSEDTDLEPKEYTYDDVIYLIEKHLKIKDEYKNEIINQFWMMYAVDAILGNRDRHWGNWGYLKTKDGYKTAPVYDNGASLYPGVYKVISQFPSDDFLRDRVLTVPASLLKIRKPDRLYRSNYLNIMQSHTFPELDSVKNKIAITTTWSDLYTHVMQPTEDLPVDADIKRFWVCIVVCRFRAMIMDEPLDRILDDIRRLDYAGIPLR